MGVTRIVDLINTFSAQCCMSVRKSGHKRVKVGILSSSTKRLKLCHFDQKTIPLVGYQSYSDIITMYIIMLIIYPTYIMTRHSKQLLTVLDAVLVLLVMYSCK